MKTLKQFINKSLVKSDHINEGIINIKDYRRIMKAREITPQNKEELRQIIEDTIKKEGNRCDLNFIDTSEITDMRKLFAHTKFNGDISKWDVSNVTTMDHMFFYSDFNGDISKWDVSKVTNMDCMFMNSMFNGDISDWDVSNIKRQMMYKMFEKSHLAKQYKTADGAPVIENGHFVKK